jgi:RNA polymerase sigma-70 factor (ECF subfamily)
MDPLRSAPRRDEPTAEETREAWRLVEAAQGGDGEAFERLFAIYRYPVRSFVRSLARGDDALADDITSEAFAKMFAAIGGLKWQGSDPGAYLFTVARNRIFDEFKSHRVKRASRHEPPDLLDSASDPFDAVLDRVTALQAYPHVSAAMERLTPAQRKCLDLRYLRERSVAETAEDMQIGEDAVKALTYRALRSLRRLLGLPESTG